ncbi:MAG: hypothetical protein IKY14_00165, partial [Erysipelotrichaceae bacterium]|nr:hypothetical protein [Erysipelotrichaceae bacterium]
MKKLLLTAAALLFSMVMALMFPYISFSDTTNAMKSLDASHNTVFNQKIEGVYDSPRETTFIYVSGKLVGAIEKPERIDQFLDELYHEEYEADYPGTSLGLGEDVYLSEELSLYNYEDIDSVI